MKMAEVKEKAVALAIPPKKMKKTELIHAIQRAEGYTPCFGKSCGQCSNTDCCFINDCIKIKQ